MKMRGFRHSVCSRLFGEIVQNDPSIFMFLRFCTFEGPLHVKYMSDFEDFDKKALNVSF